MNGFDYIIIGAGAAGCVLANRLSANPSARVALIEAGAKDHRFPLSLKCALPIGNGLLLPREQHNWPHSLTGGSAINHRLIASPHGRLLGGCTSVSSTVYVRGNRIDYDEWAALGNPGWTFADVLPFFVRHENRSSLNLKPASNADLPAGSGELNVNRPLQNNVLAHAFIAAALEAGYPLNDDFNGERQDGFGLYELNQRGGMRLSSSRAFLHPIMRRPNLKVFTDTMVERLTMRGTRVSGVSIINDRNREQLSASAEVIVCAGALNSPQLLMLSGIGRQSSLQHHEVRPVHDLPGVGENLQDHPRISVAMTNPGAESYALSWRTAPRVLLSPLRYVMKGEGMLTSNLAEAGGFVRSRPELDRPDLQLTLLVGMKEQPRTFPRRHGVLVQIAALRPSTRGSVELRSADPLMLPLVKPQLLEDSADVMTLANGLRHARQILSMPSICTYAVNELSPGRGLESDQQLDTFIRKNVTTAQHPAGTCKMGPASDPMAVVDAQLRVHGIEGLRVADASIMPNIVSGNTGAAVMMIGERAADFILNGTRSSSVDDLKVPATV